MSTQDFLSVPVPASTDQASRTRLEVPMTWWPRRWPAFLSLGPTLPAELSEKPGRFLANLLRGSWLPLAMGSLFSALGYLAAGLINPIFGWIVDTALPHGLTGALVPGLVLLAILGVGAGLVGALSEFFSLGAWKSGWEPTARGVAHRTGEHSRAVTRAMASGDVVSTTTSDADAIGALNYFITNVVGSLVAITVVAVLMLRMDVGLGLLVMVGLPVVIIGVGALIKPLNRRMSAQREEQGKLTTVTTDVVAGLRVLRGIGGEDVYSARYAEQSRRVRDAGFKVAATQALLAAIRAGAPMILTALVVGASASAAMSGRITPGEFVTFYGYTTFLIWPLGSFADLMQFMTRAWVGAKKAARIASVRPVISDAEARPGCTANPGGGLAEQVTGLEVHGERMTALVSAKPGLTAALAEQLGRPDDTAQVTLGGVDLRHLTVEQARATVLVSGAHAEAFAGPLAGEILGDEVPLAPERDLAALMALHAGTQRPDATRAPVELTPEQEARVREALWVAAGADVEDSLGGIGGQLTEKARNLSGGQRQRLALARAVAAWAPVLVLIEPTSALDSHTEDLVAQRLREKRAGRTTVVVTASPLLLGRCDEVIFLETRDPDSQEWGDLREVARGTHTDLLNDPRYRAVVERGAGA